LLERCDELCMKSVDGGKRFGRGMELLRQASEGGLLRAQAMYGKKSFDGLMTTGGEPELEDEYVEAIAFLRAAAVRGNEDAARYLPGIADVRIGEDGGFDSPLQEPLSLLPESWVLQGIQRGDQIASCHP
jgi:hypothetical protein